MRAALFDVDGVLVDSPHEAAWRAALTRLMYGPWHELAAATAYHESRFTTAVYQEYVAGKPRADGARAALAYFGVADADGTYTRTYAETKQAMLLHLAAEGHFVAFPDALRLVLRMLQAGWKLGAASSSKNADLFLGQVALGAFAAEQGIRAPGVDASTTLAEVFAANVCGRDGIPGKPAPDIFLTCAAELGADPACAVVVEDAPSGAAAARAGGMRCIGVARLDDAALLRAAGADPVVTSLDTVALAELPPC